MSNLFEQFLAGTWNRLKRDSRKAVFSWSLHFGFSVIDGQMTEHRTGIGEVKRTEHIAILGKTGTGKSTFLRYLATQDIHKDRGFVFFDLHGDAIPVLLQIFAEKERRTGTDLSHRLILIEPADPDYSVGLNVLEEGRGQRSFVQIAEFAQILKQRWQLTGFGARTEELLRNSLFVLSDNGLTLLELNPLLTNYAFRAQCLRHTSNTDVVYYFASRYDRASEGMQGVMRDAILNKVSAFTSDPHFRHILGQKRSTFSLVEAIDQGYWILLNLEKGQLGEQAATLGSLFLTKLKNALFSRKKRTLYTLYCDEIQNLVAFDSGIDTLLSEARKFGISITSANQFLEQYPPQMRSAIMAIGTHVFFQLSSTDADKIAQALGGGRTLAGILKNLKKRRMVVKSGHHRWHEVEVPWLDLPKGDYRDLYERSRRRWARSRREVEQEIRARNTDSTKSTDEALDDWS